MAKVVVDCNNRTTLQRETSHCSENDVKRSKNVTVIEMFGNRVSAKVLLSGSAVSLSSKTEYRAPPAYFATNEGI